MTRLVMELVADVRRSVSGDSSIALVIVIHRAFSSLDSRSVALRRLADGLTLNSKPWTLCQGTPAI